MKLNATTTDANDIAWLGIAEGAALIERGELSPLDWTQALLDRIESQDAPLNAFLHVGHELAIEQARRAGEAIASGHRLGPLHGVPCALKDIFDTADMPTTGQSRLLLDRRPTRDASVVAALRQAGMVLIGKTATHEFAHGGPSLDLPWPPARNPWNPDHFTGSSSSGSGAALAAGLCPAALGTDTGGSIRIPAAMCGVTGLKPTYGLVSRHGVLALAPGLDTAGPMARSAQDCALLLQAIAGHDAQDPASASSPVPDYAAALTGDLRGLRIGVIRHFWTEDMTPNREAAAATEAALLALRARGATLSDVRLMPLMQYGDVRVILQEPEAFALFHTDLRSRIDFFGEDFLGRILPGCLVPGFAQVQASRLRRQMTAQMQQTLREVDVLVTIGPGPAPRFDATMTHGFLYGLWSDKPNITAPFSVTGLPTLSVCTGFSRLGLPLSMQIVGRAFDDATVLRVGDAYQRETDWHRRHPAVNADMAPDPIRLALPAPLEALDAASIVWVDRCLAQAGLKLSESHRHLVLAAAPRVLRMVDRLLTIDDPACEPAAVFHPAMQTGLAPD